MTKAQMISKLTEWFLAQVGYCEKASGNLNYLYNKTANAGSANYTCYGYEMHKLQPSNMDYPAAWCDAFHDNGYVNVFGEETARKLLHNFDDYTPNSVALYKKHDEWYTSAPKEGDQIFFKDSSGNVCHTGYVYAVDQTYVYTVEGNTSGASGVVANGGGVAKKRYTLGYTRIAGYGRPDFTAVATAAETYADTALRKLKEKDYISDTEYWKNYNSAAGVSVVLALIDKASGGMWKSNEQNSSIHWAQPHLISLCGKEIIENGKQWLGMLDKDITTALFLALIDKATGGLKAKYVDRKTDHWGRNHLDSLCDKGLITTPGAWTNFEGTVPRSNVMALIVNAFIG